MNLRNESGFSLIELLVVMSLVTILAGLSIPLFSSYQRQAFNQRANTDLRDAVTAEESVYTATEQYKSCSDTGCNNPTLSGMTVSQEVNLVCVAGPATDEYTCAARHPRGSLSYYYRNSPSSFWTMP